MIRGEGICAGTSTTGTGTLTLAACPTPPGGIDFDVFLKAKGFVSGNALPVSYTAIEYTDATFATLSKLEKGVGTLTLGASITAATLARTTVQETITGGAYNDQAPTAISIGTAANVLVFIGSSAADVMATNPYFDTALGDGLGCQVSAAQGVAVTGSGASLADTASDWYFKFVLPKGMYVRRASLRVITAYTGGTTVAYGRIYYVNSSAQPGRLALDLGTFGTNPLSTGSTNISTSLASPGQYLPPEEYFFDLYATFTGGSGTPAFASNLPASPITHVSGQTRGMTIATGGTSTPGGNANVTGYTLASLAANLQVVPGLWLKSS